MFHQAKTENNNHYKDGMRWEEIMQLSKHDLHFLWGHNTKKIPPTKVCCVIWETVKEKVSVQR